MPASGKMLPTTENPLRSCISSVQRPRVTQEHCNNGGGSSVVVGSAAQLLGEGALRLRGEATDLRAESMPAGTASFGNDLSAGD